ncbi:hypothetical protein GCM10008018_54570 [Paenibacillus marchantiophytorum]|uniref:Uncharacterized protein n=1 Tax=Paenibacillus marchantiophytorum TaxID=1619310 RepID=A0ABQ1F6Q7_9BACL|nr:hypothetical protein GCM10008018_54570 [Paenibacillus marchantiophytorum]
MISSSVEPEISTILLGLTGISTCPFASLTARVCDEPVPSDAVEEGDGEFEGRDEAVPAPLLSLHPYKKSMSTIIPANDIGFRQNISITLHSLVD